jgi:tetratricopeptide (TPR) repeat protein
MLIRLPQMSQNRIIDIEGFHGASRPMRNRIWLHFAVGLALSGHFVAADEDDGPSPPPVRIANAEALARGRQFIDYGDARFRRQQFTEAYQRYSKAGEAAPTLAIAYFRKAMAQAALGRYKPAVKSIERGMKLAPDWPQSGFRLDELYADNLAAKRMHFEQLATAAEKEADSADLMYLLGVELFFDGQPQRAQTFLARASELGTRREFVGGFLDMASRQVKRRPKGEDL